MDALFQGPLFILAVIAGAAFLFFVITAPARGNSQNRRRAGDADVFIAQAESKLLIGEIDAAESLYLRALPLADGVAPLLFSEAYYGLARCAERRRDMPHAAQCVRFALAYAPQWNMEKPAFEQLLKGELERYVAASRTPTPSA
jgi:hypothetical protein